jgi:tRNA A37 threonylcarbamoyladenosine dehydratase
MDHSRIEKRVGSMTGKTATIIGCGAAATFARHLVRCGVPRINLADRDKIGRENLCRQEYTADQVGRLKAHALAEDLMRINPDLRARGIMMDICAEPDSEIDQFFGDTDVFVAATDNHAAPRANGPSGK